MQLAELTAAERHRRIASDFTVQVRQVTDWAAPAPVPGWSAQDVVDHLVTWLPAFLSGGGVTLPPTSLASQGPEAAWTSQVDAVQALLDDPERAQTTFSHPQVGELPAGTAIDQFYTSDVFMHTWDLARAAGRDANLDPGFCSRLLDGMESMEDVIRASGQYGPRVEVPADADPQTRLIGFIGRDPSWRP